MKGQMVLVVAVMVTACSGSPWSRADRNALIKRCRAEGGTRSYCNCYLEKAMEKFPHAADMETISFEDAVDLSLDCQP